MKLIKLLIALLYPLALLFPAPDSRPHVAEQTQAEREAAGENAMWTEMGRPD